MLVEAVEVLNMDKTIKGTTLLEVVVLEEVELR